MDLTKVNECKDDLQMSSSSQEIETSDFTNRSSTTQYSTNGFGELEFGANDEYALESQKTEKVISPGKSNSLFFSGYLSQSDCQSTYNGSLGKKAMDLSLHIERNECLRTIFDDADYFARNYSYKLMPITLEAVNETIIHIEHNYCHWASSTDVEADENLNTTLHVEEERNYKKRKTKPSPGENNFSNSDYERPDLESSLSDVFVPGSKLQDLMCNSKLEEDVSLSIQPLDLSLPLAQEQKTDKMLRESQSNIPKMKAEARSNPEVKQFNINESNKENVTTPSRKIEVTISRPGQKEYYEPCEVFLNDVARISPDLIKNDCYEIDIIDRTLGQEVQSEKCRTYYIVSEATWRMFENSTERIILTNDLNIGQPIQNNERHEKPTYLMFDQYSLTESLAKICEKKGGSFEYTCLEESKELISKAQENRRETQGKDCDFDGPTNEMGIGKVTLDREKGLGLIESWKGNNQKNEDEGGEDKLNSSVLEKKMEKSSDCGERNTRKRSLKRKNSRRRSDRRFGVNEFASCHKKGGKSVRKKRKKSEAFDQVKEMDSLPSERSETESELQDESGITMLLPETGPDTPMVKVATIEPITLQSGPKLNATKVPENDVHLVDDELRCENLDFDVKNEVITLTRESCEEVGNEPDAKPEEENSVAGKVEKDDGVPEEEEGGSGKSCAMLSSAKIRKRKRENKEDAIVGEVTSSRCKKRKQICSVERKGRVRPNRRKHVDGLEKSVDRGKVKVQKIVHQCENSQKNLSGRRIRSSGAPVLSSGNKKDRRRKKADVRKENEKGSECLSETEGGAGKIRDGSSSSKFWITTRNSANKQKSLKADESNATPIKSRKKSTCGVCTSRRNARSSEGEASMQTRSSRSGKFMFEVKKANDGLRKGRSRKTESTKRGGESSGVKESGRVVVGVFEERQTRSKSATVGKEEKSTLTGRVATAVARPRSKRSRVSPNVRDGVKQKMGRQRRGKQKR